MTYSYRLSPHQARCLGPSLGGSHVDIGLGCRERHGDSMCKSDVRLFDAFQNAVSLWYPKYRVIKQNAGLAIEGTRTPR